MSNLSVIPIKVACYSKTNADLVIRAAAVEKGIANFPDSPVTGAALRAATEAFQAAEGDALDGSRKARAERDKTRRDVLLLLRQFAHHVEDNSNGDMTTFLSSGFEAISVVRGNAAPLIEPSINRVDQGNSGQFMLLLKPVKRARSYQIQYAALGPGDVPGPWTTFTVGIAHRAIAVDNLTPGTTYTFQVRAFGVAGFTAWSGSVERMCI